MKQFLARIQIYIMIWLALMTASVWGLAWASSPIAPRDSAPVMFTVASGSSAHRIARELQEAGLVRHYRFFVLTVGIRGEGDQLKPGMYELSRDMGLVEIIGKLVRGEVAASWVTVPEGYTVREIADLLEGRQVADREEFLQLALHGADSFGDIVSVPSNSLEGYLFPDTYLMTPGSGAEQAIRAMLKNFRDRVSKPMEADILAFTLPGSDTAMGFAANLHAATTIASLIEREAVTGDDRTLISSVIRNRLRLRMPLQIDATVQYALGEHRARLFYRDYETPSEYNTYLRQGLPPGPIASPGLLAIKAALSPAQTDYLYYVATANGSHRFSRTLEEHNRAVAETRRERKRSEAQ